MGWRLGTRRPAPRRCGGAVLLGLLLGTAARSAAAGPQPGWVEYLAEDGQFRWHRLPFVVELESLLPRLEVSAGHPVRQEMAGFGPGWGADAQVFWRPPPPVDAPRRRWPYLRAHPAVPEAGRYRVTLVHTVAPDFGTVRVLLEGRPVADFDGYGAKVAWRRLDLGELQLGAGPFELLFTVVAKNPASTAYCVGLDRLELQPLH
ncbi:MAG: hypothetical protein ACYDA8_11480 [Deferrisomatales bacterium]